MFCNNCGAKTSDSNKFCESCGAPISQAASASVSTPPPTPLAAAPVAISAPPQVQKKKGKGMLWLLLFLSVVGFCVISAVATGLFMVASKSKKAEQQQAAQGDAQNGQQDRAAESNGPPPESFQSDAQDPVGLGVSRRSLQSMCENAGFRFSFVTPVKGQPRVMSAPHDPKGVIELIGPDDNLCQVDAMVPFPSDNLETRKVSTVVMLGLLKNTVGLWADAPGWLRDNIAKGSSKTYRGCTIQIEAFGDIRTLTIKAGG